MRPLAVTLLLVWTAGAVQLIPLSRPVMDSISPATAAAGCHGSCHAIARPEAAQQYLTHTVP
ncbi:MAG: hypothetical protein A3F70_03615 [Acidobacteria bacterium RIFCSPLOWO2_12_FULL_67_14]|nr:MAG: hypothetical protein A3H29_15845 [Acidobacteria bacterium RIFCSPLOWO2_02_FULL_67_21]OFW40085.1 MAG: hypothetical protein A3F70_03615 [Acidobacteria bacterium RIFCSPLOWO2_12_FULL_67_14]